MIRGVEIETSKFEGGALLLANVLLDAARGAWLFEAVVGRRSELAALGALYPGLFLFLSELNLQSNTRTLRTALGACAPGGARACAPALTRPPAEERREQ